MNPKDVKEVYAEVAKDKPSLVILRIILGLIALFLLVAIILACIGRHVNLGIIEFNKPKEHPDTVYKFKDQPIVKMETQKIDPKLTRSPILQKSKLIGKNVGMAHEAQLSKIVDTSKNKPQFNFNNSPVTNSAVGINPTVINNNGIKQRELSNEEQREIVTKINALIKANPAWNKSTPIYFGVPPDNEEASRYADKITYLLSINGYTSFHEFKSISVNHIQANYDIENSPQMNDFKYPTIYIFPAKNIQ